MNFTVRQGIIQDARTKVLYETGCPRRHLDFKPDPNISNPWREAFEKIKARLGSGFTIGIIGDRGNGKTQMGVELIRYQVMNGHDTARYISAMDFFLMIKESYKSSESTERSVLMELLRPTLLVIDEMGKRAETEWENRLLFHLIDKRYAHGSKDTLLISNQNERDFKESLGPSTVSRMHESGGYILADWPTYRK